MQFFTHEWYVKGFSLASDNSEGNFIFQSESYIYMKVADNGIKYMQIPVSIWALITRKAMTLHSLINYRYQIL